MYNILPTGLYRPVSERGVENGYIDLFLERDIRVPDVKYEWLLELKYLKIAEQKKIDRARDEGLRQLREYAESRNFTGKKGLRQALVIFVGKDRYLVTEIAEANS